ncbi:amidohydrolase [Enemella evansiae]|uniref:amidohydrolase n=1 Tax=Enemella evansiae TaxID=2016499 RepID=UPI000B9707C4|nr:amidohydrolase [Enemella evansiae]OYO00206.1 amidohydrolase [Enemella evansiae]OYO09077.1 amidohydrolase [Enemella evansiae]
MPKPTVRRASALLAGAVLVVTGCTQAPSTVAPDLILTNGEVLTMDAGSTTQQAVAIDDGRITAVGSSAEIDRLAGSTTKTVDLAGRTVVPGLTDGHTHAIRGGQTFDQETYWLDATSLTDALGQLTTAARDREPNQWVAVVGSWVPNQFAENRVPTVEELSAAVPNNPAYVQYLYDWALVNQSGIDALGLNTSTEPPVPGIVVERDPQGRATGKLTGTIGSFNALTSRLLAADAPKREQSLQKYLQDLNSRGITAVIDDSAGPAEAYQPLWTLRDTDRLTVRTGFRLSAPTPGREAEFFETQMAYRAPTQPEGMTPFLGIGEGPVAGVNDGVTMGPGFVASPESLASLEEVATLAASRRIPMELHAYTDDAAAQILGVLERVNAQYPIKDLRWAMAHLNTGSPETIRRMQALGMAFSVQMGPYFEGPAIQAANGPEVAGRSATRMALDAGVLAAGGSDATRIGDYRIWPALEYNVTGASPGDAVVRPVDQRLNRMEALRLYTTNSAWLSFADADRGSIEPGKLADLAVLDRPYLTIPETEISEIRSVLTLLEGKPVFDQLGVGG